MTATSTKTERPSRKLCRRARSACRAGEHAFGRNASIGGGIKRRVCVECGHVTIDLTEGPGSSDPFE